MDFAADFLEFESDEPPSGTSGTPILGRFQTEFPLNVSLNAAELAAGWCDFLERHARKVYASELYPGIEAAHALASVRKVQQIIVEAKRRPAGNTFKPFALAFWKIIQEGEVRNVA